MSNETQPELVLEIPLWGKILIFLIKFLPFIPPWLKAALPIIIGLIEALPLSQRREAKAELTKAMKDAHRNGNANELIPVVKKYCTPGMPGCGSDLVRE